MSDWKDTLSQMVYSTDQGRIDPEPEPEDIPAGDGIVRLQRETKGRKGKGVTLVSLHYRMMNSNKSLKSLNSNAV